MLRPIKRDCFGLAPVPPSGELGNCGSGGYLGMTMAAPNRPTEALGRRPVLGGADGGDTVEAADFAGGADVDRAEED